MFVGLFVDKLQLFEYGPGHWEKWRKEKKKKKNQVRRMSAKAKMPSNLSHQEIFISNLILLITGMELYKSFENKHTTTQTKPNQAKPKKVHKSLLSKPPDLRIKHQKY